MASYITATAFDSEVLSITGNLSQTSNIILKPINLSYQHWHRTLNMQLIFFNPQAFTLIPNRDLQHIDPVHLKFQF